MFMRKQYQWIQAVVLLFIVFAVYVAKINHTAGIDEVMTFFKYTRSLPDVLLYDAPNNHFLHSILVWLSTALMGPSLIAIRIPAFMASFIALALLYRLGKCWGNHYIGLIALMLMGITHGFFTYTVDGRGYTLTILFAILLIDSMPLLGEPFSRNKGIYAFLLSMGILLLIPSNGFLLIAIIGWQFLVAAYTRKPKLLINSAPYIIGSVLCAIFYAAKLLTTFPDGLSREFHVGFRNLNGFIFQSVLTLFENPAFSILLMGVFLWGALITFLRHRTPRFIFSASVFVVSGILILIQWVVTDRLFFPRNFLYLLPLITIIGAIGIYSLSKFRINLIVSVLLLIGGLWGIQTLERNSHVADMLVAFDDNALDGDVLFVGGGVYDPLYYHIRLQGDTLRDYFVASDQSDRFVIMPTTMEVDEIISLHELDPYIDTCTEELWNGYEMLTCSIVNGPYTSDSSRCFVSIYPFWRDCGEEDMIQSSS